MTCLSVSFSRLTDKSKFCIHSSSGEHETGDKWSSLSICRNITAKMIVVPESKQLFGSRKSDDKVRMGFSSFGTIGQAQHVGVGQMGL